MCFCTCPGGGLSSSQNVVSFLFVDSEFKTYLDGEKIEFDLKTRPSFFFLSFILVNLIRAQRNTAKEWSRGKEGGGGLEGF